MLLESPKIFNAKTDSNVNKSCQKLAIIVRIYAGSDDAPVQSIPRFRSYTGSENTSVQSIHRFRAYIGSEHTPVQSIRRFRV